MYKYLLFDLDNTLIDDDLNRKYSISKVLDYVGVNYDEEKLERFIKSDNEYWKKMAAREFDNIRPENMTKEETFIWTGGNRMKYFFKDITFEEGVSLNNKYMKFMKEKVFPFDDTKEVIEYLYKKYTLYIITNGPEEAAKKKIEEVGAKFFKDFISSENVGYMKPRREFYEAALKKFKLKDLNEILIIGDELDKDILGASKMNIASVWVNHYGKVARDIKPTYEINKVKELKKIL